ncbi:MAG: hypothetical protein H6948_02300 [Zoogloeaceae bacterium]|nr:hypothetical protein [Zoogloeaceae bacterium]
MATWLDDPQGFFGIQPNQFNAKTLPFSTEGIGAANAGINQTNIIETMQRLYASRTSKDGGNKSLYDAALKWATNQGLTDVANGLRTGDFSKVSRASALRAWDHGYRETSRAQQHKSQSFFSKVGDFALDLAGSVAGAGLGLAIPVIGPVAGAVVGGTIQGGAEDGWKGAAFGALKGYGVGSTAAWAAGKLGLTQAAPIIDKTTSLSGGTAAAGNTSSWLNNAASAVSAGNTVAGAAAGGKKVGVLDNLISGAVTGLAQSAAGALTGKLVGAIVGDGGSGQTFDNADDLMAAQTRLLDQQKGIYDYLLNVGKQDRNYYLQAYRPVEQQAINTAKAGVAPDYEGIRNLGAQAAQRVGEQYDIARGSAIRDIRRLNPRTAASSAPIRSLIASTYMGEAADKAGAFTRGQIEEDAAKRQERKYAEETTYKRRADTAALGKGVNSAGVNTISSAAGGVGSNASATGNQAQNLYSLGERQAAAAGDSVASWIGAGNRLYSLAS